MKEIILFSIFFGIIGTLVGSILGILFAKSSLKSIGILLGYTAGIMIGIVSIEVIPSLLVEYDIIKVILYLILGVVLTHLMDDLLNSFFLKKKIKTKQGNSLIYTGFLMFIALALHNIPEGIALASSSLFDPKMGLSIGLVIASHDIPEGMAISGPLVAGGVKKTKAFFYAIFTSTFTIIGSLIGLVVGGVFNELIYVSLALASGAMLYVAYKDLIPRSLEFVSNSTVTFWIILGIISSIIIISL